MTSWRNIILDPVELAEIYEWLDSIPLSRPKGQIEKDFADGVLVSEIVKHYFPQIVDLRNYNLARNLQERMSNWRLLNGKIFIRLGLSVPEHIMTQLSIAKAGIIEVFLYNLRESIRAMMLYRDDPLATRLPGLHPLHALHHPLNPLHPGLHPPLPGTVRALYDPRYMYKYNMLNPTDPLYKYADLDLHFYRKQILQDQARLGLKSGSLKTNRKNSKVPNSKSPGPGYADSNTLPPLLSNRAANNVSKIEIEEKNQEILVREEELETLRAKLKRLEHLVGLKDARIQDLSTQIDKLRPGKRGSMVPPTTTKSEAKTPVKNEN